MKKLRLEEFSPSGWVLAFCFAVSFVTLIVYLAESLFSNETLYLLLAIIRYSSFFVSVCAIYKLVLSFYRFIKGPSVSLALETVGFFILLVYGMVFFFFESFINVISRGNG